jgi:hypothetical protein
VARLPAARIGKVRHSVLHNHPSISGPAKKGSSRLTAAHTIALTSTAPPYPAQTHRRAPSAHCCFTRHPPSEAVSWQRCRDHHKQQPSPQRTDQDAGPDADSHRCTSLPWAFNAYVPQDHLLVHPSPVCLDWYSSKDTLTWHRPYHPIRTWPLASHGMPLLPQSKPPTANSSSNFTPTRSRMPPRSKSPRTSSTKFKLPMRLSARRTDVHDMMHNASSSSSGRR